jgi:hypothetical protein
VVEEVVVDFCVFLNSLFINKESQFSIKNIL